jgi:2-dehydropantoate 2-reductase
MGSRFGGLLAHAGEDVTLLARGDRLAAIPADSLTVATRDQGTITVRGPATDRPESIGPVDLILFCVKDYDTVTAAAQIRPLVATDTLVISVQNGVDCAERIGAVLGHQHVLGG